MVLGAAGLCPSADERCSGTVCRSPRESCVSGESWIAR